MPGFPSRFPQRHAIPCQLPLPQLVEPQSTPLIPKSRSNESRPELVYPSHPIPPGCLPLWQLEENPTITSVLEQPGAAQFTLIVSVPPLTTRQDLLNAFKSVDAQAHFLGLRTNANISLVEWNLLPALLIGCLAKLSCRLLCARRRRAIQRKNGQQQVSLLYSDFEHLEVMWLTLAKCVFYSSGLRVRAFWH